MRWTWIVGTTLAILALCGLPFLLWPADGAPPPRAPEGPAGVEAEKHYYVLLAVVEVEPEKRPGKPWDSGGSAPDLYYEIWWQGTEVFESATKSDTLVARWTNVAVDLKDVAKGVSLDDSIKAARIAARSGTRPRTSPTVGWSSMSVSRRERACFASAGAPGTNSARAPMFAAAAALIERRVYAEALAGPDLIGRFDVAVDDLTVGDQAWTNPGGRLKSVTCRVLPLDGVDFATLTR